MKRNLRSHWFTTGSLSSTTGGELFRERAAQQQAQQNDESPLNHYSLANAGEARSRKRAPSFSDDAVMMVVADESAFASLWRQAFTISAAHKSILKTFPSQQ